MYVGRFAPSPTGPLHFGSLVAAAASWLDARAARGRWLVRIEDLDRRARSRAPPTTSCARSSASGSLGMAGRFTRACAARATRRRCRGCRRARTGAAARAARSPTRRSASRPTARRSIPAPAVPACRPARRRARCVSTSAGTRYRSWTASRARSAQDLAREVGDFVLYRADGQFAYQLAVVVDDAEQGVTDVVRGADLLDSTARQIHLQRLLGYPHTALPARPGGGKRERRKALEADRRASARPFAPRRAAAPGARISGAARHRRPRRGRCRLEPRPDPAAAHHAGRRRMTVVRAPSTQKARRPRSSAAARRGTPCRSARRSPG